jgi:uncharacterized OB-fold protein
LSRIPIATDLLNGVEDGAQLIAGRCESCSAITFPLRGGCSRCGSEHIERHLLGRRGTLWSWTSQGFPPKAPFNGDLWLGQEFRPWFVGLVEIGAELRVEALLAGVTAESIRIGMPLDLVVVPFRRDENGDEVVTFAFAPVPHESPETQESEEVLTRG